MTEFDKQLKQAIQRGLDTNQARQREAARQQMNAEDLKRKHTDFRLGISERIEQTLKSLVNQLPGFEYENIYGDLSDGTAYNALARDHDYGPKFLEEFQDRLLFGTDLCFFDMPVRLCDLLIEWRDCGKISDAVFRKVARENAVKLLGL